MPFVMTQLAKCSTIGDIPKSLTLPSVLPILDPVSYKQFSKVNYMVCF